MACGKTKIKFGDTNFEIYSQNHFSDLIEYDEG